jgi:hypothetical protein
MRLKKITTIAAPTIAIAVASGSNQSVRPVAPAKNAPVVKAPAAPVPAESA